MQTHLYILCEGELDEMFYERIAERVTGRSFVSDQEFRLRQGANWKSAMAMARLLIHQHKHWTEKQDIAVIIAVDNDRAPGHPGGKSYSRPLPKADLVKEPRYPKLVSMLEGALGSDRSTWPVHVALAVPVEMIESWVLTLLHPDIDELPPFPEASRQMARLYYGTKPPPQLKDLRNSEAKARGLSLDELFWLAADQDLEAAEKSSASLALFLADLRSWSGN
jgi:hypothetical protein